MNSSNDILQRKKNIFADDEHKFKVYKYMYAVCEHMFTDYKFKIDIVYGKLRFTGTSR